MNKFVILSGLAGLSALLGLTCPYASAAPAPGAASGGGGKIDYQADIRPILSDYCFACHGPDKKHRKAKLRLDTKDGLFATRDDITAVKPGDLKNSELYARITTTDIDDRMPPKKSRKQLKPAQIALIKNWIAQGAPWAGHWAYTFPKASIPSSFSKTTWQPINDIDRYVLARLMRDKLKPAPDADKRSRLTVARRLNLKTCSC